LKYTVYQKKVRVRVFGFRLGFRPQIKPLIPSSFLLLRRCFVYQWMQDSVSYTLVPK
jgi:hypothetical protein